LEILLRELIGLIVWLVANAVYLNSVRKGTRGFRRFLAFWMGLPATFFTLLLVTEGSQPALAPPPDDEEGLLEEIRRNRGLAPGDEGDGTDETSENTEEEGA